MKMRSLAIIISALLFALSIVLIIDHASQRVVTMIKEQKTENGKEVSTQVRRDVVVQPQPTCRKAFDRNFVADELGRVCSWNKLDYLTGCCPREEAPIEIENQFDFPCDYCQSNCCTIYAYCISCCLKHSTANDVKRFDKCTAACRTSSVSVVNEKEWKSPLKYCFPKDGNFRSHTPKGHVNKVEDFPKETTVTGRQIPESGDILYDEETSRNSTVTSNSGSDKSKSTQSDPSNLVVTLQEQLSKLRQENEQLATQIEHLSFKLNQNKTDSVNVTGSNGSVTVTSFVILVLCLVYGLM